MLKVNERGDVKSQKKWICSLAIFDLHYTVQCGVAGFQLDERSYEDDC